MQGMGNGSAMCSYLVVVRCRHDRSAGTPFENSSLGLQGGKARLKSCLILKFWLIEALCLRRSWQSEAYIEIQRLFRTDKQVLRPCLAVLESHAYGDTAV